MGAAGIKATSTKDPVPVETGSVIATADNIKKDKTMRPVSMVGTVQSRQRFPGPIRLELSSDP